ncbi:O-Antigen ligase [compost metagenome]|uniref:O-antigen ligase family protein n=1 Tax=Variovorax boronicumulans TaxID=436515 RepID=UPI000FB24B7E|nr:O-antigen ligase family protein [Variovorax boronicumulans]PBI85502.1 O-Antigen ligase [Variovorax boronicumulans]
MHSVNMEAVETVKKTRSGKWMLGCLLVAVLLRVASESTASLSYLFLAAYALFGRAQVIQAFVLSWLLTMLNPGLAPDSSGLSAGRYLVIFAGAVSVGFRSRIAVEFSIRKLSFFTLLLGIFLLAHSVLFSAAVDFSILKAMAWVVVVLTLLSAWQGLSMQGRKILFDQLQTLLVVLMLVSLPLLVIPTIGYLRNGTGFQGVLNHPQAFGPTIALVGTLVGGRLLGEKKPRWRDIALLGLCFVLVVLSGARTAGLAMVAGLVGAAALSPIFAGVSRSRMVPGLRSQRFQILLVLSFVGVIAAGPVLVDRITNYLFKQSDASTLFDAAEASRGFLVQKMIVNIEDNPLVGIGFGIASELADMEIERDSILGLPLSAVVEKGVMPIAVLEELGIFGAAAVLAWLFVVLRRGARAGVQKFAVLITLLMVNFGESMFFSVGGMGMLLLVLLSASVVEESL